MPAIRFPDRGEDSRGLAPLHGDHDLIRLGPAEVRLNEGVSPTGGRLHDRRAPSLRLGGHPPLVLRGNVLQDRLADRIQFSVGVEEVLKNPTTRSGCWNGWISPLIRIRSKHRYAKRMLFS
jgi:hypothetical protein